MTPSLIFAGLQGVAHIAQGFDAPAIAESIALVLRETKEGSAESKVVKAAAYEWCIQHDYQIIGKRISGIFRAL